MFIKFYFINYKSYIRFIFIKMAEYKDSRKKRI
jgi:hypothetical protein